MSTWHNLESSGRRDSDINCEVFIILIMLIGVWRQTHGGQHFLDSRDWIKRRQPAEHSHAFFVLFWLIGCDVTSSFRLLLLWLLCCHGLQPRTTDPGNPFSLSCFWQGILSLLQKRKWRQLFCPFPASLTRCLQQQPSRTALQLIKNPLAASLRAAGIDLPQSSCMWQLRCCLLLCLFLPH